MSLIIMSPIMSLTMSLILMSLTMSSFIVIIVRVHLCLIPVQYPSLR